MSNFTPAQIKAIEVKQGNVLVSAGAGSGKTKVLTERVRRLVVDDHVPIDSLVVLTFTKAAAHEMKERIRKALLEHSATQHLAAEVDASDITTFDAYALSLVKKYHDVLKIPRQVNNLDETIMNIEKKRMIAAIFDEYYQQQHPVFLNLIQAYVLRDDQGLQDFILKIDAKADLQLDKPAYLENYLTTYFSPEFIEQSISEFIKHIHTLIDEMHRLSYQISHEKELANVNDFLQTLEKCTDFDSQRVIVLNASIKNKVRGLEETDSLIHDAIKERLNEAKTFCSLGDKKTLIDQYLQSQPFIKLMLEMVEKLNQKTTTFKQTHQSYLFADIAKMALTLLDDPLVQTELKSKIRYIMIDEYQDTSDLQEAFLQKIADNNLYMVGDIKQSIYRFRNANSAIFADKFAKFGKNIGGLRVDLNHNFRSREEVLIDINQMFSSLMSIPIGGADYRQEHIILFGNTRYSKQLQTPDNHHMSIYHYTDENDPRKDYEIEAHMIAQDILRKIHDGYLIVDKESFVLRPVRYEDFTILLDRKTHFEHYRFIFEKYAIPLDTEKDEAILSTDVALTLLSLIHLLYHVIQNDEEKIVLNYFMSIARSFLYRLDDQLIFAMMKDKTYRHHEIMTKIDALRKTSRYHSLSMTLTKLLETFDVYHQLIRIGNIQANLAKIENMVKLSQTLENLQFSLSDFVQFFEDIEQQKMDIKMKDKDAPQSAVKIMSIHGSKGLEFPIVYYAGLSTKFNRSDQNERFIVDHDYGIHLPSQNEDGKTLFHYLMKTKENQADISEKIRLFYVALTRAREKVILLRKVRKEALLPSINDVQCLDDFLSFCPEIASLNDEFVPHTQPVDNVKESSTDAYPLSLEEIQIQAMVKSSPKIAAKPRDDDADLPLLLLGTELHYLLEIVDFSSKDTSFITDKYKRSLVDKVLSLPLFSHVDNGVLYREFPWMDEASSTTGIMDGFIVYKDKIILFDYKLSNIDDISYDVQVKKYGEYLCKQFALPVEAYLISMVKGTYRKIHINEE